MATINVYGPVGSVSETTVVGTINVGAGSDKPFTLGELAADIGKLLELAKQLPDAAANPEDVAALQKAKENAEKGDLPGAIEKLKKVAAWVVTGIRDIGTNIAAAVIRSTLGLP